MLSTDDIFSALRTFLGSHPFVAGPSLGAEGDTSAEMDTTSDRPVANIAVSNSKRSPLSSFDIPLSVADKDLKPEDKDMKFTAGTADEALKRPERIPTDASLI
jgi:hypothetical protein